jgi:hypothetical protein
VSEQPKLRIIVEPAPTQPEMAAITAAVLTSVPAAPEPEDKPKRNPWREAGKHEALRVQEANYDDRIR